MMYKNISNHITQDIILLFTKFLLPITYRSFEKNLSAMFHTTQHQSTPESATQW